MSYVYIFMNKNKKGIYNTLIVLNNRLIINNTNIPLIDIESIEGVITGHSRVENISGDRIVAELLPVGFIKFKIKNREDVIVNSINPFVIIEDLVLKLNTFFDKTYESKFYLKESSVYKIVYSRV